jgi:hypothetical protein
MNVEVLKNENTSYFDISASGGFDIQRSGQLFLTPSIE